MEEAEEGVNQLGTPSRDRRGRPPIARVVLSGRPSALGTWRFGEESDSQIEKATNTARTLLPIAKELLEASASQDVEVLKAQIANHRRMRAKVPEPLKTLYSNKIKVLQAKLRAAEQAKLLEQEEQQSTRNWRLLGYSVTGTGIAVGLAATVAVIAIAGKFNRESR